MNMKNEKKTVTVDEKALDELLHVSRFILARLDLEAVETDENFPAKALRDDLRSAIAKMEGK